MAAAHRRACEKDRTTPPSAESMRVVVEPLPTPFSAPIRLTADSLHRDVLRRKHFMLERIHARRGLVDAARERDGSFKNRLQPFLILDARTRILVLDNQVCLRGIERQQLAGRKLMVEP